MLALSAFHRGRHRDSRCLELRVKRKRPHCRAPEKFFAKWARSRRTPDGLRVEGRHSAKCMRGNRAARRSSHRHGFAVAALPPKAKLSSRDADCAAVSYPRFFDELRRLAGPTFSPGVPTARSPVESCPRAELALRALLGRLEPQPPSAATDIPVAGLQCDLWPAPAAILSAK